MLFYLVPWPEVKKIPSSHLFLRFWVQMILVGFQGQNCVFLCNNSKMPGWISLKTLSNCSTLYGLSFPMFWKESAAKMQSYCWNGELVALGNTQVLGFSCNSVFVQRRIALKTCATITNVYTGFRFREFWKQSDTQQKSYRGNGELWFERVRGLCLG